MQVFNALEGLVSNKLEEVKLFISMVTLEARLAGLSIFPLIATVCLFFVVLMAAWLATMCMLGYAVMLACGNVIIAIACTLLFNMMVLYLLFIYLQFNLKKMSFEKTRQYLGARS